MNRIIIKLAAKYGVSPENVENEMRGAIREAMQNQRPEARSFWEKISSEGEEPSLEVFLNTVSDMVVSNMNSALKEGVK